MEHSLPKVTTLTMFDSLCFSSFTSKPQILQSEVLIYYLNLKYTYLQKKFAEVVWGIFGLVPLLDYWEVVGKIFVFKIVAAGTIGD